MTKSPRMERLLNQLKVQVLLYSGTLLDPNTEATGCMPLVNTAVALEHERIDKLLLSLEREAKFCACNIDVDAVMAPVHQRICRRALS